jgi:hypothetical protein
VASMSSPGGPNCVIGHVMLDEPQTTIALRRCWILRHFQIGLSVRPSRFHVA